MPEHEEHEHEHEHEEEREHRAEPAQPPPPPPAGAGMGAISVRLALTVIGAGVMILGVFLGWLSAEFGSPNGTEVGYEVFWSTDPSSDPGFFTSAGALVILVGLVTLGGAAFPTGFLSRIGAILGIVAFALFVITLYRVEDADLSITDIGIGMWLILAGGVVALVGGFMGSARPATT